MDVMRCPVCQSKTMSIWEEEGGVKATHWWTGRYVCPTCGNFAASGTVKLGERAIHSWHPACPDHGTDPVFLGLTESHDFCTHDTAWICGACGRRFEVKAGKLETTWTPKPYQPVFISGEVVDQAMERLGGLPHD